MADDDHYIADAADEGYEGLEDVDAEGVGEVEFAEADGKEGGDEGNAELEAMRAKLRQMEEEAAKLREMQAKVGGDASASTADAEAAAKEEADSRSVYVGQVDYACTPEELQLHFQGCGTVNRVTILTDKFGNPKGFAYIEFLEADAVPNAVLLDGTELRGRQIKVTPKRTNVPGFKRGRGGRGRGGHYGGGGGYYGGGGGYYGGRGGYYAPYRGRGPPRGRGRGRFYAPY